MILGIMGGMGPLATCDLFKKIIELTEAATDKEHLHIVIDNNTQIPDRTAYILGYGQDPKLEMINSIKRLESAGADYIVIACNTAHYFYDDLVKHTKVNIIHMIEETASFLNKTYPERKEFLLLSTKGTYKTEIYQKAFNKFGLKILEPNQTDKEIIMDWIYKIKASNFDISLGEYKDLISRYIEFGDSPVILGCTELSLLPNLIHLREEGFVNPTLVLAQYCVKVAKEGVLNIE